MHLCLKLRLHISNIYTNVDNIDQFFVNAKCVIIDNFGSKIFKKCLELTLCVYLVSRTFYCSVTKNRR